jgi:thymidine phosphorylase
MDAALIGRAPVFWVLAAKRRDAIDFAVGISALKKIGECVQQDEPVMFVHARDESAFESVSPLLQKAAQVEGERSVLVMEKQGTADFPSRRYPHPTNPNQLIL